MRPRSSLMQTMLSAVAAILLCAWALPAQTSKPITYRGLLDAINTHGLSNAELTKIVKTRGVDFELTPEMEAELAAAGADANLLVAVRTNFRGTRSISNVQPPASQPREASAPGSALDAVQVLFDQKKYDDARTSFDALASFVKTSFDGQLLLCKIEQERKQYREAMQACNSAIQSRPNVSTPYGLNAFTLLMLGESEQAEAPAAKAAELSGDLYYKKLLGIVYYAEEKYGLVPKQIPADSKDSFSLTLLAGAAFHNRDYEAFQRYRGQLTTLKGKDHAWNFYADGLTAQQELRWDDALDKFKKCAADGDMIDPICSIAAANTELTQSNYSAAKADIDEVLKTFPKNQDAVMSGIFINLRVGDYAEAERLHGIMNAIRPANADFMDCLYYYGRSQPLLATKPCQAAVQANQNSNTAWSNAGYAALDNGDFQSAISDFAKAWELFYASKEKHTVIQELDLWWGSMTAEYFSGDKKRAKELYNLLKKTYPQFTTTLSLKQLPLLWSDTTVKLMDKAEADLK